MKLDYIYHSGFAIEADGVTVIIDYYKDSSEEEPNRGIVHDRLLKKPGDTLRTLLAFPPRPLQPRSSFMEGRTPRYPVYLLQRYSETPACNGGRRHLYQ